MFLSPSLPLSLSCAPAHAPQLLEDLHGVALELREAWGEASFRARFTGEHAGKARAQVVLQRGDAVASAWGEGATFLFCNSTCFTEPLMLQLAAIAERMPVGAFAVTLSKRLPSAQWVLRDAEVLPMTWGVATVHIFQKAFAVGGAQGVGTAPPELKAGSTGAQARLWSVGGPSYTATELALSLQPATRAEWEAGR